MQRFIYILFIAIFISSAIKSIGGGARLLAYIPEVLSVICFISVLLLGATRRTAPVSLPYVVLFMILGMEILLGAVLNNVPSGAMFAGIRNYLKFIPFFFLPFVYTFTEKQLKQQLIFILALSLLQLPIALYQRFITSAGLYTGDYVVGTMTNSGSLSIYLVSALSVVYAFYLKGLLSGRKTIVVMISLSLPTMINETKVTIVMLPIMALVPVLSLGPGPRRAAALRMSFVIMGVFLLFFIPIYDYYIWDRYGYGLLTFLTMEGRVGGYLAPTLSGETMGGIGKLDAIVLPFMTLAEDPFRLIMGLGIGNVSESFLGSKFHGEYLMEYGMMTGGSISKLTWEIGVAGILLLFVMLYMMYRDTQVVKRQDSTIGALALGWTGVLVLMLLGLSHSQIINVNAVSYLFWYLSGHIVAASCKLKQEAQFRGYSRIRSTKKK